MTRTRFTCLLLFFCTIAFAQEVEISGMWKHRVTMYARNYTFNADGTFKRDDYGDMLSTHSEGHYTVLNNRVYLIYDSVINFKTGKYHPANDTLLVINKNVIRVNKHMYIFNRERGLPVFSVDKDGILNYTLKTFGDTLFLQQQRFYKWVTIDSFVDRDSVNIKNYQLNLHSGNNKFRIQSEFASNYLTQFEIASTKEKIKIERKKITDYIQFSGETYFELYDEFGRLIAKGFANRVNCSSLPKGVYFLNYDNDCTRVKKI